MAYDENTPANINERFSVSQQKIRDNFISLKSAIEQDHVAIDDANEGKHKRAVFTEQAADQATLASEIALYAKDNGAEANIYLRKESNGDVFNLTPSTAGHLGTGYESLPSGLLVRWGTLTLPAGQQSGTVAAVFPTNMFSVQLTPSAIPTGDARDYVLHAVINSNVQFTVWRTNAYKGTAAQFHYLAIGN